MMNENLWEGIDVEGTKTAIVVSGSPPVVLGRTSFPTLPAKGADRALKLIKEGIRTLLAEQGAGVAAIKRIGVSCGGPLDRIRGVILSPPNLPTRDSVPIKAIIEDEFGCECQVENDANAGAVAEHGFGAGQGTQDMVFLTMGTGLGAGIISLRVRQALLTDNDILTLIATVAREFAAALSHGYKILLFGNGGSAADARHIAAEFVGRFQMERTPLPALALTTNTSALSGIGNDYGYDSVFERQIVALGREGDVAVGISTIGKSPNVLKALSKATTMGLVTVAITGKYGKLMQEVSRYCICAPADTTPRIQEAHILIGHILSEIAELELFGK